MITDGGDTTSRITFQRALEAVHSIDGVIYAIIVVPVRSDAGRNLGGENALKTLAAHTGGETYIQYGTDNLDQAFEQILRNLRTQYLLGYYPPEGESSRERFRIIELRVNRAGAVVLARDGYFLPAESQTGRLPSRITVAPRNPSEVEPPAPIEAKSPQPERPSEKKTSP
jgi:Ca-activated chloride channel family protein